MILLTANGDAAHVSGARNAGASGFLLKPISIARFTEAIINTVNNQQPFVVAPTYRGPERRSPDQPGHEARRPLDQQLADTIILPPDGLLLAKVRGEPLAIREAWQRRAEAIAIVKRVRPPLADRPDVPGPPASVPPKPQPLADRPVVPTRPASVQPKPQPPPGDASDPFAAYGGWRGAAEFCLCNRRLLTDWEARFCATLIDDAAAVATAKQQGNLRGVLEKLAAARSAP